MTSIKGRDGAKISPKGNDCPMTDMEVRIFLRDTDPEANLLLDDFEFSPEEIRTAMNITVDRWNDMPPDICRFDRIAEWRDISNRQMQEMRRLRTQAFKQGVRGPISAEMEKSVKELLSNPELQSADITPRQARRLVAAVTAGFDGRKSVKRIFGDKYARGVSKAKEKALSELEGIVSEHGEIPKLLVSRTPAYRDLDGILKRRGLSRRKYRDMLEGITIDVPNDSVLGKIRNMSIPPDQVRARKLPDLISEKPSIIRRLISIFGID